MSGFGYSPNPDVSQAFRASSLFELGIEEPIDLAPTDDDTTCNPFGRELALIDEPIDRGPTDLKRGEVRWSDRDGGWEVFVPASAFKNSGSSFFSGRPFRLLLPDIAGLYAEIEHYVVANRRMLLGPSADPGTFFVKTVKRSSEEG